MRPMIVAFAALCAQPAAAQMPATDPLPDTVSQAARDRLAAPARTPPSADASLAGRRAEAERVQQQIGRPRLARYGVTMREERIADVPVRIFTPARTPAAGAPVLMNLPGGGFVVDAGSITENAPIAGLTGLHVVSVRYRLSPEHAYPAALEDAVAVYRDLVRRHRRVAVYGTSAGAIPAGQLVARLRREGLPPVVALGIFSGTGDLFGSLGDTVSATHRPAVDAVIAGYLGKVSPGDPAVSPERGDPTGFPPTMCVTSSRDYLLSATARFCSRLADAGVATRFAFFDGLPHAFWAYVDAPESDAAFAAMSDFLKRAAR